MRIDEIQARLAEINRLIDTAEGDALAALEQEADSLLQERAELQRQIQVRQQLRSSIAGGTVPAVPMAGELHAGPEQRGFAVDSAEYRHAWLLSLQGRSLTAQQRAAVSASGAIPTQTMNRIIARLDGSPILSAIDLTYIPGAVSMPVESSVDDASWVAMGSAATDASDAVTTISLSAYKLIKTVEITADVAAMAIDAFENWLVTRLADKIEYALDKSVFVGTGVNQATGIITTKSSATGTFTKAKATYNDLIKIIAALGSKYARNASFAMPRTLFYTDVMGIVDTSGKPVVHADPESPAKFSILGYPVICDDNVTADNILFGDFKAYKMNISQEPTVKRDDSVAFRTGSSVYRAMALADGKLAESDAFVRYTRATS